MSVAACGVTIVCLCLCLCGRFVYFSPRNMKRSKPIAEKIGISFDWNCAISLRDLEGRFPAHLSLSVTAPPYMRLT